MESLTKSKIFLWLGLSFLGGTFLASFYFPRLISSAILYSLLASAVIIGIIFWESRLAKAAGFCLAFFVLGIMLFNFRAENLSVYSADRSFSGEVKITEEPKVSSGRQNIIVATKEKFKILVYVDQYAKFNYGDNLKLNCQLEIPKNREEDSRFDYRMYLAKDNVFYICKKPKIEILGNPGQASFWKGLFYFKNKLNEKIEKVIPYPEAPLLTGLLLGGSDGFSEKQKQNFSTTGMTHIVAVSGYNVTIVAEYLMLLGISLGLWRRQAFWLAILGIFLFVLLVGFPSSAVRAGIMGMLLLWAMKNGRLGNATNAILFSAMLMLILNPLLLRYDIGFQLSFLATLGIVFVYPIFQDFIIKKQKHFSVIWEILFLTLSAQAFVLPIILYNFGNLSLISPLANVLILPIVPLTMLLGFLMILVAFLIPPLAIVLAWLVYLPLRYETRVIEILASFEFSSLQFDFPAWGVVVWYFVLIFFILKAKRDEDTI